MKLFIFTSLPRFQLLQLPTIVNSGAFMRSIQVSFVENIQGPIHYKINSFMTQHHNFSSMSNLSNDFINQVYSEGETAPHF